MEWEESTINSSLKKLLVFSLYFIGGSMCPIWTNILFNMESVGIHHVNKKFEKPLFQTLLISIAMSLASIQVFISRRCKCTKSTPGKRSDDWVLFKLISIPSIFDLLSCMFQNIALLFLPPSIFQMVAGIIVLFTAIFTIIFRHKKLKLIDWIGIIITTIGVIIVAISAKLMDKKTSNSSKKIVFGILILVVGEAFLALCNVFAERILHDINATSFEYVGFDGIWEFYILTFVILPIANILPPSAGNGIFENSVESFIMLGNSSKLFIFILIMIIFSFIYNITAIEIISFSNAVNGTIIDALRSGTVWILSVIIHYLFPDSGAGEPISFPASLIELIGFIVCLIGAFVYNKVIKIPWIDKDQEDEESEDESVCAA